MTYIAIEGLKGAGKSTLLQQFRSFEWFRDATLLAPTRPSRPYLLHELAWRLKFLRRHDGFRDWVYTGRANAAHRGCSWRNPLVLGDRSKLTSYATRWHQWGDPSICIKRVNHRQPNVPLPDHVIFLTLPLPRILARLATRARDYGRDEETEPRLREALDAYRAMSVRKSDGFDRIVWHWVDADTAPASLAASVAALVVSLR